MKKTRQLAKAILLSLFLALFTLNSSAQKVTLSFQNETFEKVLNSIKQQTGLSLIYSEQLVSLNRKVSINVNSIAVEDAMKQLLTGTNIGYEIKNNKLYLVENKNAESTKAVGQPKKITGLVSDEKGEPIIGASISVKGTNTGTISDVSGKFALEAASNAVLKVSYIGYLAQEVAVNNQNDLKIALSEDSKALDEVVVVGYGTMKKSDVTGSVTRANIDAFRESSNVSITQSLQGSVPGLNIGQITQAGQDASISVRGRNTISGTTSPLIVLDGIIYRGSLVDINSNDIESVDVLKDASATAIYGSQASNGVLIITSKLGKVLGKPVVSYNSTLTYELPSYKVQLGNTEQYISKIKDMYYQTAYLSPDFNQANPAFNVSSYLYGKDAIDGYNNGVDTDWWDLLTNKNGYIQNHTLSIRGKSNLSSYFFSVNYLDQENIMINDGYKRYSVRLNLENEVTKWMKLGVQSFLTTSDYSGVMANVGVVQNLVPIVSPYDANNQLINYPYPQRINPLIEINQDNLDQRMNLFGSFYVDVNIPFIKGLNYRANFSQNVITSRVNNYNKTANSFQGSASKYNNYEYNMSFDNILSYKRTFNDHSVNATFVYGLESRESDATTGTAQIFQNDALGYNNLEAGQADQRLLTSTAWNENSLYAMGRLHYGYQNKYLFTSTIRRDGFSGFGPNNKIGYFPSVALGWVASEEKFLKENATWLNQLKFRLSYGKSGNRTVGRYSTLAKLTSGNQYLYGDGATAVLSQWITNLPNADLKWEKTTTSNLGIDFAMFNQRISGTVEGYIGNTSDLLYSVDIPVFNGFGSVPVNIGKMKNQGIELTLSGSPIRKKDFSWDVTFNFSLNRNEVVSINGIDANMDGIEDNIISSNADNSIIIGEPYGLNYDYDIVGMWQLADGTNIPTGFAPGTYKITDISGKDGVPDGAWTAAYDRSVVGYKDPSYRFGINNSIRYKNFEFKFFINSIQGGDKYYKAVAAGNWSNIDNLKLYNSPNWDWWTPQNPDAKYRNIGNYPKPVGESVHPYSSRSFIRLQDVSLSYQFQPKVLDRLGIKLLKLYMSGKNLKTWTNWEGWDPETGQSLVSGGLPVMKSYSVGLNVEF